MDGGQCFVEHLRHHIAIQQWCQRCLWFRLLCNLFRHAKAFNILHGYKLNWNASWSVMSSAIIFFWIWALRLKICAFALSMVNLDCVRKLHKFQDARNVPLSLALVSLFEVFHQLSHFVYFYVVIFGPHFIDYVLCVKIQTLSNFGSNALQATLFATAVDRLLSSMAPIL